MYMIEKHYLPFPVDCIGFDIYWNMRMHVATMLGGILCICSATDNLEIFDNVS